ncbi:hypothetical protein HN283_14080 [Acinetobacter baumannii]|uniref:hypothetical protein n=1 Tax=Acinetobacter baumannii TaxID=470 RepID=UPI001897D85C|nr:hypothetical protein [Acinetobacter baumannii]MBF6813652.1 hypothetical protein [Acinetobacter baumannii]MBF6914204.1 hypothetical protein [Acinetobacter baumannii]MBF6974539.1 hypothetical protein [Acinetobacter baumannii]
MTDLYQILSCQVAEVKRTEGATRKDIINALKKLMGDELGNFAAAKHLDDEQIRAMVADLASGVELIAQQRVSNIERIERDYLARL